MKIRKIWIKDHKQFKDTFIDLTNPVTGEAVDNVCFIGSNGTGKSNLLLLIREIIQLFSRRLGESHNFHCSIVVEFSIKTQKYIYFTEKYTEDLFGNNISYFFLNKFNLQLSAWANYEIVEKTKQGWILKNKIANYEAIIYPWIYKGPGSFSNNSADLLIYSPAEGVNNYYLGIDDVPKTDVDTALSLNLVSHFYHSISSDTVNNFWAVLIYLILKRKEERERYETAEGNIDKTKRELTKEFDAIYPNILTKIAEVWDKILANAGLYFDADGASNPVQLNDNLTVFIKSKTTNETVPYNQLSTGIRNFIFRIGHIYSLYFNREIKNGIVLIDEPENSLFPDFLYDLIETYQSVFVDKNGENNTQLFVATHSPIIAAQFEPYERIILEWDEAGTGNVVASRGKAPAGDDPNDILKKDFGVAHLMGKRGEEKWKEYLDMKTLLRRAIDEAEKTRLIEQIIKLGKDYNF